MKKNYYFLINPAAGQGKGVKLKEDILSLKDKFNINLDIIFTKEELDAEFIARDIARSASFDTITRIYSCGGDGTLNEVVNGVCGYDNVEIGIIPTGTGNDFIRNFGTKEDFLILENQIRGESKEVDLLKYKIFNKGYESERYCINMINIGFDSEVVVRANKVQKFPFLSGSKAYTIGALIGIIEKNLSSFNVKVDDKLFHDGKSLLVAIGKGSYCGGGYKALPKSIVDDSMIDIGLVKDCSRKDILKLMTKYKKGLHLDTEIGRQIVNYDKVKKVSLETYKEDIYVSVDGELEKAKKIEIEILPKKIKFINPNEIE